MQGLIGLLGRVRERPPSGSASAPRAAGASAPREKGRGGLHSAAASGDLAQLQRHWWWKRLRINGRDARRQTPLHLACANGHADVVRFLAGKKCQLNPRDNFKKSPLMKAVEYQHKDCVAVLLEHGASLDLRDVNGNTALHLAATIPSKSIVELLVEHNAHIEAQNKMGYTPLAFAITKHHEETVKILLEKGANVHAQDTLKRTTLMIAALAGDINVVELLLRHGADLSHEDQFGCTAMYYAHMHSICADIPSHIEEYLSCALKRQCSVGGTVGQAGLDSSCSGTTADIALGAPTLTAAGVLPAAGAEQEEDDDSPFDSETDSEGPGKALANALLPAADGHGVCAQPMAGGRGNGVLPAAGAEQEEDDDSPFDSETDSEGPGKALANALLPAADGHGVCAQPMAGGRGNGVLPAAGAEQEEDDDSPFDSETDSEGPGKALANALLPAADGHGVCAQPMAGGRGNGVLPAAGAEQEEDDDSPFDSETDSEGPGKALANALLPAADGHGVCAQPMAGGRGNGVLPAAGAEQEEDDDSPFDSETDSEGPGKALANALLPAADGHGVCAQPMAGGRGNGVLPAAGAEQEEDDDSPFDSETDSEGPGKALANALLPAADGHGVCAQPMAGGRGNGVLPAAGAEQEEDDDSPFDSETDSEGPGKALANALLPAADGHGVCAQPMAGGRSNGVLPAAEAEQAADDVSCPENEALFLPEVSALEGEEIQLKKDASAEVHFQGYSQRWVRQLQQELADTLRKNSLAEASLEAKKHYSRDLQEQKLQLQKELDRSKAKLQELTERRIQTECYAESLKNIIKSKERELKTSRKLQCLLAASSATVAILELEERMQQLQAGKARLEATAQQQAKIIEALQNDLQASASAHSGLENSITAFQTTRTAKERQHQQRGSESKEVKKLAEMKQRSEALLDKMWGRNSALEEERTRLKMLLEGSQAKLMAYAGRESQLSFWAKMKKSSSEVTNQVDKLRRKPQLNARHG